MSFGSLFEKLLLAFQVNKETLQHKSQKHSYFSFKTLPPVNPPTPSKAKAQRKADVITKEYSKEVKQTDDCLSHLDLDPQPYADLIPSRIYCWTIKNYASIVQKMQLLAKEKAADLPEKISLILSSSEELSAKEEKKQEDLWVDLMKSHEERHFCLGRITNFFT